MVDKVRQPPRHAPIQPVLLRPLLEHPREKCGEMICESWPSAPLLTVDGRGERDHIVTQELKHTSPNPAFSPSELRPDLTIGCDAMKMC